MKEMFDCFKKMDAEEQSLNMAIGILNDKRAKNKELFLRKIGSLLEHKFVIVTQTECPTLKSFVRGQTVIYVYYISNCIGGHLFDLIYCHTKNVSGKIEPNLNETNRLCVTQPFEFQIVENE